MQQKNLQKIQLFGISEQFGGYHFDQESGLLQAGARYYSPPLGNTTSTDPHAIKYPHLSPYSWCGNTPIMFVDPDGKEVRIAGKGTKATFRQLNRSTSLKLSIKNGVVSAKGTAKTDADRMLLSAIQDKNVVINVDATTSNYTKEGKWFVGGA